MFLSLTLSLRMCFSLVYVTMLNAFDSISAEKQSKMRKKRKKKRKENMKIKGVNVRKGEGRIP